jgi:amino acid adenylation domain-containing protein
VSLPSDPFHHPLPPGGEPSPLPPEEPPPLGPRGQPPPGGLQQLIEAQAARTPDRPALAAGGERLSYRELHRRANRLAHILRRRGIGPESVVAVLAERSIEMVVAILGTLKAGAAYLPLDPAYPTERLAFLLADSGAAALLLQQRWRSRVPDRAPPALALDGEPGGAGGDDTHPPCRGLPGGAAYVLYTSGSTGRPKGVVNTHAGICNRLLWAQDAFRLGAADRLLQKTPFTFDVSVWEIFAPLIAGAELVLARPEGHRDSAYLIDLIRELEVTVVHFVPSMLAAFLATPGVESCRSLAQVIASGEALQPVLVRRFFDCLDARLCNLYGPTEAAIDVSAWTCTRADGEDGRGVPIGYPIANLGLHLHDGALRPVPPGATGELLIGGAGLARGYLRRADLTAASFVPDPFSGEPGARLYRTGDLARRRQDGALDYLGRLDTQVKLRGYRIELGEIEAAMRRFPGVSDAVVVVREETPGLPRLAAYFVAAEAGARIPEMEEWRRWLARSLPEHMVPSSFTALCTLPLNAHGKVDRRALPAPSPERPELAETYVAPRNAAERAVAAIWRELLHLDRIGIHDDFFQLGGHSLLAAQALARLRANLGVEIPPAELFRRPTVARLAQAVAAAAGPGRAAAPPELPPIRPAPRDGRPLPLSFAQERVWFLEQLAPGNLAYNFQAAIWLAGPADLAALERALSEIVRRHEVLRTRFPSVDGRPVQVVHAAAPVRLPLVDLRSLPAAERLARAEALIEETVRAGFDVARGPLILWRLLRLAEEQHVLVQVEHHFVHDGWSFAILLSELRELYQAFSRGAPSPLPELPAQYADYAVWQRQWLEGEAMARLLAFWRQQLAGSPPPVEIATDRPRPLHSTFRGDVRARALHPELYAALRGFGRRRGLTLYMTMLAGFLALLHRYTGEEDLVLGTSNANRRTRELELMIGMMVNSLVLRADLSGRPSFLSLLARTREQALEVQAHQDMPFERLVQALNVERRPGRNPLFQVMFNFHDAPVPDGGAGDLEIVPELRANGSAKMDINLIVVPRAEQRVGRQRSAQDRWAVNRWEYSTDLFDAATLDRLDGHLQTLLAAAVAVPEAPIGELPLLTAPEGHQLLVEWSDRAPQDDGGASLAGLFAAQAACAPDAAAVTGDGWSLTYGELADRAARLADRLARQGVRPGARVALLLDRSLDLVVAILGVLQAGAAYVPLDPELPRERLELILADARPALVIGGAELRERLPSGPPRPWPSVPADLPAYVIFTSGSTGRPKGVVVSHAAVVRLFSSTRARLGAGVADVWTLFHSCAFDFSVWELWGALLHGGRLVVVPRWVSRSPEAFGALLERERVTILNLTPSAFRALASAPGAARSELTSLRLVVLGGEALDAAGLRTWFEHRGDLRPQVANLYGITETTVHVTWCLLRRADAATGHASRIGRALPDLAVHLLDRGGEPVPAGVPGEIHVAGAGLAVGYLDRADLTAERFVPNRFAAAAGERLYRSGDLARRLADGDLEYLGRVDHQVKVRGFRIELGEIEAALVAQAAVAASVVTAHADPAGGTRLLAYVVPARGQSGIGGELRRALRQRLPEYMVPAAFVELPALPLTANGKIDRRALPAPAPARAAAEPVTPESPQEEIIAQVWAEVLGLERVGAGESFFDLGGHSLLATRITSRLAAIFGVELPLRALFAAPTVAGLAAEISRLAGERRPAAPPLRAVRRGQTLPLSFAQQRLWFLNQLTPDSPVYHTSRLYRIAAPLRPAALRAALAALVERHEVLRTRFPKLAGMPVQSIAAAAALPLPLLLPQIDLLALPVAARDGEVARLAGLTFDRPFDLARDLPLRALLVLCRPGEHFLVLCLHHIATDGWSMGILERELGALHEAAVAGRPSPLPPLPIQYGDFAAWQRGWMRSAILKREVEWWRGRLAGAPAVIELPADRPRPALQSFRGAAQRRPLPPALAAAIAALARGEGATLFMVLLAAFDLLLHRYTGQPDQLIGAPVANRNRAETEGLIGFFVNTLVLRPDLAGDPEARQLLARVRDTVLEAHAHQDLPFEKLVEELRPQRHLSHSPLFQVVLAVEHQQPAASPSLLVPAPLPVRHRTTKFDLTLTAIRSEESLALAVEYSTDLFDPPAPLRLAGHLEALLAALAERPRIRLSQLPHLSAGERHQLLVEWGAAGLRPEASAPLHERFAARAAERPDAIAVAATAADEQLTYAELDRLRNRLARRLRELGVAPGERVGILCERSPELLVAILGALAAGCAYVPLDPSYPPERLAFMLADSGVRVLLAAPRFAGAPPPLPAGARVVSLGRDAAAAPGGSAGAPLPGGVAGGEQLAYVIYTSGSTGRPKGVAVTHASVAALFDASEARFGFGPGDVWTLFHSPAFDFSVWELWGALLHGGRLVIVPYWVSRSPEAFLGLLAEERVTVLNQTPSAFRQLVRGAAQVRSAEPSALRWVILGGEALAPASLVPWFEHHGGERPRLVNGYGITETTVFVSFRPLPERDLATAGGSIGRPLPALSVHVLGAADQPVPVGVTGEILVGGPGVAVGYLGRPELTAERFVPDPWSGSAGARLYRSGDLARYRADGELEYLGRIDHQVKIRGFRVELGEIEAVLAAHPAVREARVVLREAGASTEQLVAYVVAAGPGGLDGAELRGFLQRQLPEHAVPALFVELDAFPLTAHGKVDRAALPAPEETRPAAPVEAPRTDLERRIAALWQELLGRPQVGRDDNFFDLGGHSLLVAQVQGRLQSVLGRPIPIVDLFRFSTIRSLAQRLEAAPGGEPQPARTTVATQESRAGSKARRRELRKQHRGRSAESLE